MLGGGVPSSLAKDSFSRSLEEEEGRGSCKVCDQIYYGITIL